MGRWISAAGLVAVLLSGCDQSPVEPSVPQPSAAAEELPGDKLNRVANDAKANRADRAAAVFALFKGHIKPGDGLGQVRRVLRSVGWVEEAKLYYFAVLGGWIPVDMNFEDRTYSLHLFADNEGHSEWVIYFQLAGKSEWGKWNEDGLAFLQGKVGSSGASRIKEFALCYPAGRIEVFNPKGTTEINTQR
jgi:hypothetical protein